jgi:hypothetical protein
VDGGNPDGPIANAAAVSGPITGPVPTPGLQDQFALESLGYQELEFFVSGTARSFALAADRSEDGRLEITPKTSAPFTTRMVVRRPAPSTFRGTVVVEWNNVSGGADASPEWTMLHREIIREGWAWVGVTAQKVGVDGGGFVEGEHLKKLSLSRYASLEHPGDAFSYDIFSQVGRALLDSEATSPLGGLRTERLIAVGDSQSASCLVTYVNAIDSSACVYDAFLLHSRGSSGTPIEGLVIPRQADGTTPDLEALGRIMQPMPEQIRVDARVPVMIVQTETDVIGMAGTPARQDDTDRIRLWEIAGTAHADTYMLVAGGFDDGRLAPGEFARYLAPTREVIGMTADSPINSGPQHHYVLQAALVHLVDWASGGTPPPHGPRMNTTALNDGFVLDEQGLATGGIRTPWVDVPTAILSGVGQTGSIFAMLFGTTTAFGSDRIATLYRDGQHEYLARFKASLESSVTAGFVLPADVGEIEEVAAAAFSWS